MENSSDFDSEIEEEIEEEIENDDEIQEEIEEEIEEIEKEESEESSESSAPHSPSNSESASQSDTETSDSSSSSSSSASTSSSEESSNSSEISSKKETPEKKDDNELSYTDDFDIGMNLVLNNLVLDENDWELDTNQTKPSPITENVEKKMQESKPHGSQSIAPVSLKAEQLTSKKPTQVSPKQVNQKQPILLEVPQTRDRELEDVDVEEVGVIFDSGSVSYLDPEHPSLEYLQMKRKSRATFYQTPTQSRIAYYTPAKYNYHIQQISSNQKAVKSQRRANEEYERSVEGFPSLSLISAAEVGIFAPSETTSNFRSPQRIQSKQTPTLIDAMEESIVEMITQKMLDLSTTNQIPHTSDKFEGLLQQVLLVDRC